MGVVLSDDLLRCRCELFIARDGKYLPVLAVRLVKHPFLEKPSSEISMRKLRTTMAMP